MDRRESELNLYDRLAELIAFYERGDRENTTIRAIYLATFIECHQARILHALEAVNGIDEK